ncbi:hypothetical protein CROQUDRAFT_134655 [Cronartium quercuum f. sp. fusiforme G11]|uniref:Uncharacterized protein n=1 Tax=Cronartium quercuum f. sp. fusiforme G11 TaxID=708437 RepID=A0A9P6NH46_9BASI|nr:hypothetical protein CROQUDRAFT_134655 [Cronartium quercuum f. sp. fusiforme G11]
MQDLPAKLWKLINIHHVARSAELVLLYEQVLNSLQQGHNQTLPIHTENFEKAVNRFKSAGREMTDAELGRKLMMSLNSTYFQDAREISLKGITELQKQLQVDAMLKARYSTHPPVKIAAKASMIY